MQSLHIVFRKRIVFFTLALLTASMYGKRVLVTGGAGFLGSNLCRRLVDQGHSVVALDNLSSGKKDNITPLLKCENFRFVEHDVANPFDFDVEWIFNLACVATPPDYQKEPLQTLRTSFLGAYNVLELARKRGARVMQASTSEVYGEPLMHPQKECYWGNVNPIGIRSCYDEGKRCAEALFFTYAREYKVDAKVVQSDAFENIDENFDVILLNPPQTAGKKLCFKMIEEAKEHLKKGGSLQLVARHQKGGKTLQKKMEEVFGNSEVLSRQSGFRVYMSYLQ